MLLLLFASGCATSTPTPTHPARPFLFEKDTFAYPNELVWEYSYDAQDKWTTKPREPKPTYSLHCFVVARSAKQFFQNARFDSAQPIADDQTYRRKIHQVVTMGAQKPPPENKKIVIPGFASLREFSQARPELLKAECGSAWESYFQRGHWRMIFPFTHRHQQKVAQYLLSQVQQEWPVVVHILRFPELSINHALVVYQANATPQDLLFKAYDPNDPRSPITLTFDRESRTFLLPRNTYFRGGKVKAYPVYTDCLH